MQNLRKSALALSVAAVSGLGSSLAAAQALEEVMVTATKRTESLQDVPIAVTALDERMIQQAGITGIADVALRTPGFSMGSYSAGQPLLFIRGIGSNDRGAAGGEPSVATFVDGVYINRAAGSAMEMFDLAAIEILRGPQGTLWGKNASAGVINIRTRRPSLDRLEASVEGTVGNEGIWGVNALVSGPLGDTVAGKLSVGYRERDAWNESVLNSNGDTGDLEAASYRAQLLFTPSDNLEILWSGDYGEDKRGGNGLNPQILDNPNPATEAVNFFASLQPGIDYHENLMEESGYQDIESWGTSLQIDWDLGDMTLTSITAYREGDADLANNSVGTNLSVFPVLEVITPNLDETEMFTQELRLAGVGDNLNWTTGLYYYTEDTTHAEGGAFLIGPLGPLLGFPPSLIGTTLTDRTVQENETDGMSVFGELTWSVTDALDLTFGARYTYEEKDFAAVGLGEFGAFVGNYDVEEDEDWSNPTYKVVANYRFNDDVMTYFSVATGFKSGGWQNLALSELAAKTAFDEENATNFEVGVKSMLLDNTLRLNAAVFLTDYEDLQVTNPILECGQPICGVNTVNAGEAEIKGVELEFTWAITENFQLMGNYAYLDTEYDKLEGVLEPANGNQLRNAPENAYTLVALYEAVLGGGGEISARYEYAYKDETQQDINNNPRSEKPDYEVSNIRLGYTTSNDNWEVAAWVKNAFDEEYLDHNFYSAGFGAFSYPALPRTYGLTVTWRNF